MRTSPTVTFIEMETVDITTWAVLIEAMDYAHIGTHHIEAMKKELLKGEVCQ